jgi:hypothetical protein
MNCLFLSVSLGGRYAAPRPFSSAPAAVGRRNLQISYDPFRSATEGLWMPVKYHQAALAFQVSHKLRYAHMGRDRYQHVDVIRAALSRNHFHPFPFAQLSQNLSHVGLNLTIYYLPAILRRKHYMVLASPLTV